MKKDQVTEAAISMAKSAFSAIPFAGGALNEIVFDYRSRLKQNRLNSFVELLSAFFTGHPDIDPERLKTEEFSDLFESVIRRVLQTKSKEKHLRFRDILTWQILYPASEIESAEICLELISTLDEMAINILQEHHVYGSHYAAINPERQVLLDKIKIDGEQFNDLKRDFNTHQVQIGKLDTRIKKNQAKVEVYNITVLNLQKFREAEFFGLTDAEYLYYKQTLYAKGLLIDKGIGTHGGSKTFHYMWLTEFGERFLDFIRLTS
jgi:hypothetical protein